jgi:hypothetical protein
MKRNAVVGNKEQNATWVDKLHFGLHASSRVNAIALYIDPIMPGTFPSVIEACPEQFIFTHHIRV